MSTNKTTNLTLHSWVESDMFKMEEVNENFNTIDTEVASKLPSSEKGVADGVATLDSTGKVPSTQLKVTSESGDFSDTSTAIQASGTYTKKIPLSIKATNGHVIAKNAADGTSIFFGTDLNNTTSIDSGSYVYKKGLENYVSGVHYGGSNIRIQDCYIDSGTDELVIIFKNYSTTDAYNIALQYLRWTVHV